MMKTRVTLVLIAALLLVMPATLRAEDDITVKSMDGPVKFVTSAGESAAEVGVPVKENTAINTDDDRSVTFAGKDGLTVKTVPCPICHKTIAMVIRRDEHGSTLGLAHGGLLIALDKMPEGKSFEVHTPLAVSAVRGTKFWSHVQHDGSETISVNEGVVAIENIKDGSITEVKAHESADISITDGSLSVRPSTAEEKTAIDQV